MTDNLNKMTPLQFFKHLQHWIWLFPLRDPDVHLFTGNTTDNVFKCHICGKHITREEMHKHYDMEGEMTDFSKYTDKQINEAIFEAKGWTREGVREFKGKQYTLWKNPDPTDYGQYAGGEDDYTHDWRLAGELLEEMKLNVNGVFYDTNKRWCCVMLGDYYYADTPRRAICEAWLAWKGTE